MVPYTLTSSKVEIVDISLRVLAVRKQINLQINVIFESLGTIIYKNVIEIIAILLDWCIIDVLQICLHLMYI